MTDEHREPRPHSSLNRRDQASEGIYVCPMHRNVSSDRAGRCRECGMALEPPTGVTDARRSRLRIPWWLGFCLLLAIALFFLWGEHRTHILGALPYLLFLACPLIHLLMHRGHGGHGQDDSNGREHGAHRHEGGVR